MTEVAKEGYVYAASANAVTVACEEAPVVAVEENRGQAFALRVSPNPSRGESVIELTLSGADRVDVVILDVKGRVQVSIDPLEVARDVVSPDDRVYLRDGGKAGIPDSLRMVASEAAYQIGQPLVGHHREVRCRVSRVALAQPPAFEQDDRLSGTAEEVRGGQARQASADDHDVALSIGVELRVGQPARVLAPVRSCTAGSSRRTGLHADGRSKNPARRASWRRIGVRS